MEKINKNDKEFLDKLKYLIKKKGNFQTIADELELEDYELLGIIELLKREGQNIEIIGNTIAYCKAPLNTHGEFHIPIKDDQLKFLMLSDTHLASKYDNVRILQKVYEEAERRGIKIALHNGDILDGRYPTRAGNEYEIRYLSADEQIDYTIKKYPEFSGQTYFITGKVIA